MGNYPRDNREGGDRGGFRGGGGGGYKGGFKGGFKGGYKGGNDRGERGPVTMHSAVCSSCGKTCEVPFRPTGDKPVYCRDCFAGRGAMGGDRSQRKDPRTFSQNTSNNTQPNAGSQPTVGNSEVKKQLEAMNVKLDKLISIVQEMVLKGALKGVTNESKDIKEVAVKAPKVFAKVGAKAKKVGKKK
jgi:CxxC-x17-CxxC domain-containing protein